MVDQLRNVWRYREFVWILVIRNIKVKYQQSLLGFLWTLLNPLFTLSILLAVFTRVVRIPIKNYWAFLLSGYFVWNFIHQVLIAGTLVLAEHTTMIRSVAFPTEVPVLAAALSRLFEFLIEFTFVMVLIAALHHKTIPISFALSPVLVVIQLLLVLGFALPIAAIGVLYYDIRYMLPIVLTALFYISPIFYSVDLVPEKARIIYMINPIAHLLEIYHTVFYEGIMPSSIRVVTVTLITVSIDLAGYAIFNRYKPILPEVV